MGDKVVSVRVPKEVADRVKEKAKKKDVTVSQVVRKALRKFAEDDD